MSRIEDEMEGVFRTFLFKDPENVENFDGKLRACLEADFALLDDDDAGRLRKYVEDESLPFSAEDRELAVSRCRAALIDPENVYEVEREYVLSLNLGGGGPSFDMEFRYRDGRNGEPQLVSGELVGSTWGKEVRQPMPPSMAEELFDELVDMGMAAVPAPGRTDANDCRPGM